MAPSPGASPRCSSSRSPRTPSASSCGITRPASSTSGRGSVEIGELSTQAPKGAWLSVKLEVASPMKLYLRCLFCLALSVLGPLLSTDSPAFADDHTSRLLEQTYIYDTEGRLKEIVDSSGVASPSKLPKACGPINGPEQNPRRSR